MDEKRKGRQTPTVWSTLPYTQTDGKIATDLYNGTGRTAQEWQINLMNDILAKNDEGLWIHTKYGYSVPRRNGKNEIVAIRELYGMTHGEQILHTAHRVTTSSSASRRLVDLLVKLGWTEVVKIKKNEAYSKHFTYAKQVGAEKVSLLDGSGGVCSFRTRTAKGGLGEGFDLLVIDEAQEYTDEQETSLKYVVTDSANPQTIFCGTPETAVSSGTVFKAFREKVTSGKAYNSGWAEWSVQDRTDCDDIDAWYETNPSLGTTLTERAIADEVGTDEIDFNIQRLGLWISYNQASAITRRDWDKLLVNKQPKLKGGLFVGIKYGNDGTNVAVSIACKTVDDRIFISTLDMRSRMEGNGWILNFIRSTPSIEKIAIDGKVGQMTLIAEMRDARLKKPITPTGTEFIVANATFEKAVFSDGLVRMAQPSLDEVITNCEKKPYGSGGFVYKPIVSNLDICVMDSVTLAVWLCSEARERKVQKVAY